MGTALLLQYELAVQREQFGFCSINIEFRDDYRADSEFHAHHLLVKLGEVVTKLVYFHCD